MGPDSPGLNITKSEGSKQAQTQYVWQRANIGRSFLFYDRDGNVIQISESAGGASWT